MVTIVVEDVVFATYCVAPVHLLKAIPLDGSPAIIVTRCWLV